MCFNFFAKSSMAFLALYCMHFGTLTEVTILNSCHPISGKIMFDSHLIGVLGWLHKLYRTQTFLTGSATG